MADPMIFKHQGTIWNGNKRWLVKKDLCHICEGENVRLDATRRCLVLRGNNFLQLLSTLIHRQIVWSPQSTDTLTQAARLDGKSLCRLGLRAGSPDRKHISLYSAHHGCASTGDAVLKNGLQWQNYIWQAFHSPFCPSLWVLPLKMSQL